MAIPTDHPRPAQSFRISQLERTLAPAAVQALRDASHAEGATLFMAVLVAFQVFLHRRSGRDDIRVATLAADRGHPHLADLIGVFFNTLLLRAHVTGAATFRELLHQARRVTLDAYDHQDVPFRDVVEALERDARVERASLCEVMLVFQREAAVEEDGRLHDLVVKPLGDGPPAPRVTPTTFDLVLDVTERPGRCVLALGYRTDLFEPSTVARMLDQLEALIERMASRPDAPIEVLA